MKKLLFLVLIVIAICSSFETDTKIETYNSQKWIETWDSVKSVTKNAVDFLKKYDLYYPILDALKKDSPNKAVELCYSKGVQVGICNEIKDIFKKILYR